jgi:pilus assembly protein TadC
MLISFWWVVVAFILGGTFGALGLAIFSGMPEVIERDAERFAGIGHTR